MEEVLERATVESGGRLRQGHALGEIKRRALYEPQTWKQYCQTRWAITPQWANEQPSAGR